MLCNINSATFHSRERSETTLRGLATSTASARNVQHTVAVIKYFIKYTVLTAVFIRFFQRFSVLLQQTCGHMGHGCANSVAALNEKALNKSI